MRIRNVFNTKRIIAAALAAVMASMPLTVQAASPESARDAATWARLRDNVMEYEELEMLVEEYNKTYLTNQTNYLDMKEDQTAEDIRDTQFQTAMDLQDAAEEFRDQADGIKDLIELMAGLYSGAIPPQVLQQMMGGAGSAAGGAGAGGMGAGGMGAMMSGSPADTFNTLSSAYAGLLVAANMSEQNAIKQEAAANASYEDSEMKTLLHKNTQNGIKKQVQGLFASYKTASESLAGIEMNINTLQAIVDFTERQKALGMATEFDLLTAKSNLQSLQATYTSVQASVEKARQSLLLATGWNYNDNPEIREVPAANLERLNMVDFERDLKIALDENLTLKYDKMALSNMDSGSADFKNMERTIANQESSIKTGMTTLFNDLNQKKLAYDLAQAALAADNSTMRATETKWQLGMIGKLEYLQAQATHISKEADVKTADMALQQAIEAYDWALKGVM